MVDGNQKILQNNLGDNHQFGPHRFKSIRRTYPSFQAAFEQSPVTRLARYENEEIRSSSIEQFEKTEGKPKETETIIFESFTVCQKLLAEGSHSKLQAKEEQIGRNKNATNFEEEQSVCLISSSSEIEESFKVCETAVKTEKSLTNINGVAEDNDYDCSTVESAISETNNHDRPIFVDLTTDEKKPKAQTVLASCCNAIASTTKESQSEYKGYSAAVVSVPDHRIMIADSSSRINHNENISLATALRDRGPCLIPVQPNLSLPIRPVPSVPTRSFRKDCLPLFILTKSSNLNIGGVESIISNNHPKEEDVNCAEKLASKNTVTTIDYVVPQISSVESLSGIRSTDSNDVGTEEEHDTKGNRKKKRSHEADSSQSKEFLTNFCGSNTAVQMQNLCTDKCIRIVSTSKEENHNKVVPPLRLKKIVYTEAERHSKSQTTTGIERESNYRIVTDASSQPPCSPSSSDSNETNADMAFSNTDSYKLKCRRNRLKQKLEELRSKALELAEKMANDANPQQNTRLRQVMNRYEKQIENLSKLHSKLSAAFSVSKKLTDMNNKTTDPNDDEYSFANLTDENAKLISDNTPASSPEPPKLSPRSPLNYDNMLQEDVRNSPPILSRIYMPGSMKQDSVDEEVQITEKKVWTVDEESLKAMHPADSLQSNTANNIFSASENPGNTSVGEQDVNVDIENSDLSINKISLNHSENITEFPENKCTVSEEKEETKRLGEEVPRCRFAVQKSEKLKCLEFSDPAPVSSPVTSSLEVPVAVQKTEMVEIPLGKQVHSSTELISEPGSYKPHLEDDSFTKVNEGGSNAQKVTSSSGQSVQSTAANTVLNEENLISQQNYKGQKVSGNFLQKSGTSHPMTEQFPTLGNWLARMSNKQTLKSRSKLKTVGNSHVASTESSSRIPGYEASKASGPNAINDIVNTTPQYNMERWQYHNHQEQRQQLLQHVASSVTLSQPGTAVPTLRPAICPPIPMTQFYPNNYTIDPYNSAALTYHPAIYPYGTYPYHSRLHASSLPAYHFPMQDSLRPMQPMNKRFPLGQDPMIRYSSPSTSTLQHPSDFDRLRGSCLSSLFLPSPTLPPSHQTLPRAPLLGYPANSQFSRNRMVPDVVAAAAAAAVVAAASFDRQRDTLTYNRADTDTLSTGGMANIINGQTPHVPGSNKLITGHRETSNQAQENNLNGEAYENTKYQQMQNFLFDRLALVETADNFAQRNSVIGNDTATPAASILSTTPYRMPLVPPSHAQLSKNAPGNESRSCETPHLGKINRSPNSLHNFTCSNCGIVGPKFKCLGCELAFYCNERCQEEHWYVHVQKCPKKMPKLKKVT